jgi:lactate dehydrogenase-like 2-hydroxyacid dehydrogenase
MSAMTEKPDVLFVGAMPDWWCERMEKDVTVHHLNRAADKEAFLKQHAPKTEVLLAGAPVDAALISKLPKLKLIASMGAGYERIDVQAARQRGVVVTNTPHITDGCVADMAMALLLAWGRHIVQGDKFVRSGAWMKASYPLVPRVHGRRMGILGLGRIGLAIARRAAAFDMPIAYHNRRPRTDVPYWYYPSLVDMARDVDVLMVATPGGDATHRIVTAEVLKALGPKGVVVNIARGSIIDEPALVKALKDGTIAGAALDVFEFEPKVPEELLTMDNVVLMPHRGGGSYETWADACNMVKANIQAFFKTGRPLTPVPETPII